MTDERSDTAPQHWARHKRRIGVALIAAVSTVALGLFVLSSPQQSATTILKNAEKAMKRQDFKAALELAEIGLQLESQRSDGRMFAADAAAQLGDAERSLRHCLLIPDSDAMYGLDARILTATLYRHLHKDRLAEEHLHRALQIAPDCIAAHKLLSSSYSRHGRRWESIPHLLALLRATSYDIQDLRLLAAPDSTTVLGNIDRVKLANSKDPYDLLAVACSMMALEQTPDLCEKLLQRCIAADESLLEAKVRYGRLLLNRGDSDLIENWDNSLPQQADEFPETWLIRAEWCMQSGKLLEAASCFLQALEMHPNHAAANYQLGQTLTRLGKGDEAEKFLLRAEHLRTIIKLSAILARQYPTPDQDLLHEITNSLELTGRYLEAICWLNMATSDDDITARRQHLYDQIGGQITSETPWTRPAFLATKELKFAISEWKSQIEQPDASQRNSRNKAPLSTNISFNDSTKTMGINHQFHFGAVDDKPTGRIFEITGGGIATLDFDLDDWPDLYLSQAGKSPPFQVQQTHFDQLYRNYQGKQFAEVAELASIHDDFFGQGVAAGDINNDGFPDLYVANIDGNQIYLNNGDGTFFNQTRYSNVNHRYWTTSCAIADITGDSIPDLYDVTYVDGDNILTLTCPANGTAGTCSPLEFDSPPDFLWQGVGDGTFTDSTKSTGFSAPLGTGLAILVGAFSSDQQTRIFVANDGRANFYFTPDSSTTANQDSSFTYTENAIISGTAFDRNGRAQASMGIATADFNGDLKNDFLITNFVSESNALYIQLENEHYVDQSQAFGVYESSLQTLGFGAQAIDADLDGWPDVMIANGHINSHPIDAPEQRMLPSFYRNICGTTFKQLDGSILGAYFKRPSIGRSMAVIDWNRDGLPEVAIGQIGNKTTLLENTSNTTCAWLNITLHGRTSSRNAVGSRVVLTTDLRKHLMLVTAGDGYQCSNQKQLRFGLQPTEKIQNLTVYWPNGKIQTFTGVNVNTRLVIREGDRQAFNCP